MGIPKDCFEIELNNGEVVPLTLSYAALYKLRNSNKPLYDSYNKLMNKKDTDELDMINIIYIAYVCASKDKVNAMSFEKFLELVPGDRSVIGNAIEMLLVPKKKQASQKPFGKKHRK